MKTKIDIHGPKGGLITFTRENDDPKFHGQKGARGEKRLFHYLCKQLNALGFSLMWLNTQKEGHMLGDEFQPIARPIKRSKGPNIAFYSGFYALRGANEDWNKGEVELILVLDYFEDQPPAVEAIQGVVDRLAMIDKMAGLAEGISYSNDFKLAVH